MYFPNIILGILFIIYIQILQYITLNSVQNCFVIQYIPILYSILSDGYSAYLSPKGPVFFILKLRTTKYFHSGFSCHNVKLVVCYYMVDPLSGRQKNYNCIRTYSVLLGTMY